MNEKCFGLRKGRECAVLEDGICRGNYATCPFYKPKWKCEHDRQIALRHIADTPPEKQRLIAGKYYHGQMPWAKEDL